MKGVCWGEFEPKRPHNLRAEYLSTSLRRHARIRSAMADSREAEVEHKGFPPLIDGEEIVGHQPCAALVGKKVNILKTQRTHKQTSQLAQLPHMRISFLHVASKDFVIDAMPPAFHAIALAPEAGTISIPCIRFKMRRYSFHPAFLCSK